MILIPWLGILVYVIARGSGMQERAMQQATDAHKAQVEYYQTVASTSATRPRTRSPRPSTSSTPVR